jgi:hypothetical protein
MWGGADLQSPNCTGATGVDFSGATVNSGNGCN